MKSASYRGFHIKEVYGESGTGATHVEVSEGGIFVMSCDSFDEAYREIDEMEFSK